MSVPCKRITYPQLRSHFHDGMSILFGGFMGIGTPEGIVRELLASGVKDLTLIGNDTALVDTGVGVLVANQPGEEGDRLAHRHQPRDRQADDRRRAGGGTGAPGHPGRAHPLRRGRPGRRAHPDRRRHHRRGGQDEDHPRRRNYLLETALRADLRPCQGPPGRRRSATWSIQRAGARTSIRWWPWPPTTWSPRSTSWSQPAGSTPSGDDPRRACRRPHSCRGEVTWTPRISSPGASLRKCRTAMWSTSASACHHAWPQLPARTDHHHPAVRERLPGPGPAQGRSPARPGQRRRPALRAWSPAEPTSTAPCPSPSSAAATWT